MLCTHIAVTLVIRIFHCFNEYKSKEVIAGVLLYTVKYLKENFGDIADIEQIIQSLAIE